MSPDTVAHFYDRHPYPPPISDLTDYAARWADGTRQRVEHHRIWPRRAPSADHAILVAGCGTSQAAKYAIRQPTARVVGIDVSATSIEHTRSLAAAHRLDNLELHQLDIERVGELGQSFDQIVCTGVLHHLPDPDAGLRALSDVLSAGGALDAMVYAPYGRAGVYLIQDYCRRLGVGTSASEIADLVASLRELPAGHPLGRLLRETPDFQHDDALADALLHPQDRSYSVPELLEWIRGAGLEFGRWVRQAPYLPSCGSMSELPHRARIEQLAVEEQFAALELFRGVMTRHSFIAHRSDDASPAFRLSFDDCGHFVPIRPSTVIAVEERLPRGAAAALLNRAHEFTDLVMFVDSDELVLFDNIDGRRSIDDLEPARIDFFRRLFDHDLVVFDASARIGGKPE